MKRSYILSRQRQAFAMYLFLLVVALPALAAEGGEENPAESPLGMGFRWVHFAILAAGLLYLMLKKAPTFFRGRADAIVSSISESRSLKQDAERILRTAEGKLARLEQEVAEFRAGAQRDAAAEAERIRAAARDEAGKIERAAQAEMEAAERAARIELRAVAARLAVERGEALIRAQITPEKQAALFRSFVENLGSVN